MNLRRCVSSASPALFSSENCSLKPGVPPVPRMPCSLKDLHWQSQWHTAKRFKMTTVRQRHPAEQPFFHSHLAWKWSSARWYEGGRSVGVKYRVGAFKGFAQLSTLVLAHSGSRRYRQPEPPCPSRKAGRSLPYKNSSPGCERLPEQGNRCWFQKESSARFAGNRIHTKELCIGTSDSQSGCLRNTHIVDHVVVCTNAH